jgi:hypothetical protein
MVPLAAAPLLLTAASGSLYSLLLERGIDAFWLLKIHTGKFGLINLQPYYSVLLGMLTLVVIASGLAPLLSSGSPEAATPSMGPAATGFSPQSGIAIKDYLAIAYSLVLRMISANALGVAFPCLPRSPRYPRSRSSRPMRSWWPRPWSGHPEGSTALPTTSMPWAADCGAAPLA